MSHHTVHPLAVYFLPIAFPLPIESRHRICGYYLTVATMVVKEISSNLRLKVVPTTKSSYVTVEYGR